MTEPYDGYLNYDLLYKRGYGKRKDHKTELVGSLDALQVGDLILYCMKEGGYVIGVVWKVNVKAGKLRVARSVINGWVMRPSRTFGFDEILKALHPTTPETIASAQRVLDNAEGIQTRAPTMKPKPPVPVGDE